jgi:predicted cobalt transporter CbtA
VPCATGRARRGGGSARHGRYGRQARHGEQRGHRAAGLAGGLPEAGSPASDKDPELPTTGFDGILVAAAGTALTAAGWLLLLAGSRRLRSAAVPRHRRHHARPRR